MRCWTVSRRNRFGANARAKKSTGPLPTPGKAYGVGLACVSTVFGNGSDPAFALVEIDCAGRVSIASQAIEIGNGIATALAVRVADKLGTAADEVKVGRARWLGRARAGDAGQSVHHHPRSAGWRGEEPALGARRGPGHHGLSVAPLTSTPKSPPRQRTSCCASASGRRLWQSGRAGYFGGQAAGEYLRFEESRFVDGRLTAGGMEPLARSPPRRQGARDGARHRRHGARLQSLVLGTCHLRSSRRARCGRIDALAVKYAGGGSPARKALMFEAGPSSAGSRLRYVSADAVRADRRWLHVRERHRSRRRDRQGDRRRVRSRRRDRARMRACSRAPAGRRTGRGRVRDGRRLRAARTLAAL